MMNDRLFIDLRRWAKEQGRSVFMLIENMNLAYFSRAFPWINPGREGEAKARAKSEYQRFKDEHFARLYNAGLITAGASEHGRVVRARSIFAAPHTDAAMKVCFDIETQCAAEALTQGTEPMYTEQLRAALAESEANDAAEAAERAARLTYLQGLAGATGKLIAAIQNPSNNPVSLTVYAKELKALAEELGARIVPTNAAGSFLILVRN